MNQVLVVRGKLPDFNTMINDLKRHWKFYANAKRQWTGVTVAECLAQRLRPVTPPVVLDFVWYTNGRKDPDNVRVASKMIIDGLVKAEILPQDTQKIIKGFTDSFHVDKDDPRVEVTIRPIKEDD
jgi:Holliday junction resolvase RusA-like endonuclease